MPNLVQTFESTIPFNNPSKGLCNEVLMDKMTMVHGCGRDDFNPWRFSKVKGADYIKRLEAYLQRHGA